MGKNSRKSRLVFPGSDGKFHLPGLSPILVVVHDEKHVKLEVPLREGGRFKVLFTGQNAIDIGAEMIRCGLRAGGKPTPSDD